MPEPGRSSWSSGPTSCEFERQRLLDALAAPPPGGTLLFAVSGGMYAEGVDYPGELLSAVFVVSPALPQVSFERELLRRYFDEREESGFDYAYLQPGMTRVVQAAGRLIRSENGPRSDRPALRALSRGALREPPPPRLVRREPAELATRDPATRSASSSRSTAGRARRHHPGRACSTIAWSGGNVPTSVRLDAETERTVERLARARRSTKSRVIREAILAAAERERVGGEEKSIYESIAHLIGVETGGPRNLSENTGRRVARLLRERERRRR